MSGYKKNFKLKDKVYKNNIFYAPLAGYTDFPFRKMARKYSPGLIFTEMVKIDALVRFDTNSFKLLSYDHDEHPIGAQLCGSKTKYIKDAARIIEDLGFDHIDLNCGCPVDKVTKDGSGSGLLKKPNLIGDLLSDIVSTVTIPVSVKIRSGWDEENINAEKIVSIAEEAGADLIIVHGRTKKQGYRGSADLDIIKKCKQKAKKIKVFGNGDVFSPQAAKKMFEYTKCDGILIARGMIGNPSIVRDIENYFSNILYDEIVYSIKEQMLMHFDLVRNFQIEKKAILDMRRLSAWYLKRLEGAKKLKIAINSAKSTEEIYDQIDQFLWESLKVKDCK